MRLNLRDAVELFIPLKEPHMSVVFEDITTKTQYVVVITRMDTPPPADNLKND